MPIAMTAESFPAQIHGPSRKGIVFITCRPVDIDSP